MQNNNKKASILLWAVMLSLIIAITFISISTKINKNIKLSGNIRDFNEDRNKINLLLFSGTDQNINSNKSIIFDNNQKKIFALKKNEEKQLSFSGTTDFNIDIGIINGGPIDYDYVFDGNITSSGIIDSSNSFSGKLDTSTKTGSLVLKNLGGYTKFLIKSENEFEENSKNYKIVTKIGNILLNETKGTTKY